VLRPAALGLAAGLLLLAVAVVALAPASLVDPVVAKRTGGRVRLADAGGFWWRGHGVVTSNEAHGQMPIAWRVRFLPLARGRIAIDFIASQPPMPSGTLEVATGVVEARDLQLTIPAALLAAFVPTLTVLAPDGDVELRTPSFSWHAPAADGRIDAAWQDARLSIAGIPVALGRITGSASGAGERIAGAFDNTGGDLRVSGRWRIDRDSVDATTTLVPDTRTPPALRAVLPMLGSPASDGSVRIEWRGRR
jgi:type II secretion system (T2SS) protein N